MGLDDYAVLGTMSDELDGDDDQEDVNESSLFYVACTQLVEATRQRISKYDLENIFDDIKEYGGDIDSIDIWEPVLKELIKFYSLNPLKFFLSEGSRNTNLSIWTRQLLLFIKNELLKYYSDNPVKNVNEINRESLKMVLTTLRAPYFMKYTLFYIDNDSLGKFAYRIFNEFKLEYM